jgi:hypothetical protein
MLWGGLNRTASQQWIRERSAAERFWEGNSMARVALVTGGTRGIGAAISTALKHAGYKVAANYGGNDEAANQFNIGG